MFAGQRRGGGILALCLCASVAAVVGGCGGEDAEVAGATMSGIELSAPGALTGVATEECIALTWAPVDSDRGGDVGQDRARCRILLWPPRRRDALVLGWQRLWAAR